MAHDRRQMTSTEAQHAKLTYRQAVDSGAGSIVSRSQCFVIFTSICMFSHLAELAHNPRRQLRPLHTHGHQKGAISAAWTDAIDRTIHIYIQDQVYTRVLYSNVSRMGGLCPPFFHAT
jgi:hypothetical protein